MKELFALELPLGNGQMTTVRLATGGVAASFGLGLDDSEDLKLCVTESLLLLLHAGSGRARVEFSEDGAQLFVAVLGAGETTFGGGMPEDDISEALLSALAEDALVERKDAGIVRVSFRFSK